MSLSLLLTSVATTWAAGHPHCAERLPPSSVPTIILLQISIVMNIIPIVIFIVFFVFVYLSFVTASLFHWLVCVHRSNRWKIQLRNTCSGWEVSRVVFETLNSLSSSVTSHAFSLQYIDIKTIAERKSNMVSHLLRYSDWFNTLIEGYSARGRSRQEYMDEMKGVRTYETDVRSLRTLSWKKK